MSRNAVGAVICLWCALSLAGCSDDGGCPEPDGGGGDTPTDQGGDVEPEADVPPTCTPPEITCDSGMHAVYGLCVPDADDLQVAGGAFDMGVTGGTDFPLHNVTLAAFNLDRLEVSNALYQACVGSGCCTPPTYDGSYSAREPYYGNLRYADYPVIFVTWAQAQQYCAGLGKGLPTEAQWEFAARGTDGRTYPWGTTTPTSANAHFNVGLDGDTASVGSHGAGVSPAGAEDLAGNVWEWVGDWYSATYYTESPAADPPGPATGAARVVRGGSFGSGAEQLFSYYRMWFLPGESYSNVGFRCAW
jgi:formylglycine-generating enzyme required for sulfatase activity